MGRLSSRYDIRALPSMTCAPVGSKCFGGRFQTDSQNPVQLSECQPQQYALT